MSLTACVTWCVGGCECLSQSQYTCCPVQTITIAIDLNINSCGSFYKSYVQTFNAQLWERFTDHQRVINGKKTDIINYWILTYVDQTQKRQV